MEIYSNPNPFKEWDEFSYLHLQQPSSRLKVKGRK
jgi:hypothetical protein